jgi:membrane protein YdbS with pleckstrin-like domain
MSNIIPPTPPSDSTPHKEPSDTEEVYFEGSPPLRGLMLHLLLWPLAGLVLIAAPIVLHFTIVPSGPPLVVWASCILVGLGLLMVLVLISKTIHYRITNYRIDYERGLISKDIDTLELWHIEDLHFHQSLLDRILGVGTIQVTSRDEKMPELLIRVPNPRPLYETLKQRVIAVKRARGVIKVDPG